MRQNYLRNKALAAKYKKGSLPQEELERKRIDDACSFKMTAMMKKMQSPTQLTLPAPKSLILLSKKAKSVNRQLGFKIVPSLGTSQNKFVARVPKESRAVVEAWENNEY
jgi:hypothetical protein